MSATDALAIFQSHTGKIASFKICRSSNLC